MNASTELDPSAFSLEFFMSADPLSLTKVDLDQLVQYHRNIRADRAAQAAAPKGGRKRATAPSAATPTGIKALIASKRPAFDRRGF